LFLLTRRNSSAASGPRGRDIFVDQVEPAIDAVKPRLMLSSRWFTAAKSIFMPATSRSIIPRRVMTSSSLCVDAVEPIVEPGEAAAQEFDDLVLFAFAHLTCSNTREADSAG
jgi:hypothetical protein